MYPFQVPFRKMDKTMMLLEQPYREFDFDKISVFD